ncbi:MAG TPA: hypothetical protein VNF75_09495 [Candidatus Dormibacteraeota bacterium]|nr:hypothetical protein [Candidatus Dormibacteraeota bacterium]
MSHGIDTHADRRLHGEALLRRATVWAGLGVMVATGAAAAAVAHALPGKTAATAAPVTSSSSGVGLAPGGSLPGNAGGTSGTAPAPANSAPVVTSGGS